MTFFTSTRYLFLGRRVNQKKNEISKFPSLAVSKFFRFFEISSEEISKFVKNRDARTSATTSVENDRIQIRTIV